MEANLISAMIDHMDTIACTAAGIRIALAGAYAPFAATLAARETASGIWEVELVLTAAAATPAPEGLTLRWAVPAHDLHCVWRPDRLGSIAVLPDWTSDGVSARSTVNAPVMCLHATSGANRLTAAFDDAMHATRLVAGLNEEHGEVHCVATPFASARPPTTRFAVRLRLDLRAVAWHAAIRAVGAWWAAQPGYAPCAVPEAGRRLFYSTWYTLHQRCEPERVEAQCAAARALGCEAIIVDDGWQTRDGARGYRFTGDWEPERMGGDAGMRAHVDRVHALGLKYLLWFSVPFIGFDARCFRRFEPMLLRRDERSGAGVVDPRFPEVREHFAALFARCVRDWDLDGLKLDFVDSWSDGGGVGATGGRDIADLDVAVDLLLKGVMERVRSVKPDALIEFRQTYYGPLMRTYGNLFRAGDCPADILSNRARTLDVRTLVGGSATHADMLMWHRDEPVEAAALQLLAVLFAVPQISVDLNAQRPEHAAMLRFWCGWWDAHRATLLDGELDPRHPELQYPVVAAATAEEAVLAVYADAAVATLDGAVPPSLQVVNATRGGRVVLELERAAGPRRLVVRDCQGRVVEDRRIDLAAGVNLLAVPPAGVAAITG